MLRISASSAHAEWCAQQREAVCLPAALQPPITLGGENMTTPVELKGSVTAYVWNPVTKLTLTVYSEYGTASQRYPLTISCPTCHTLEYADGVDGVAIVPDEPGGRRNPRGSVDPRIDSFAEQGGFVAIGGTALVLIAVIATIVGLCRRHVRWRRRAREAAALQAPATGGVSGEEVLRALATFLTRVERADVARDCAADRNCAAEGGPESPCSICLSEMVHPRPAPHNTT